MRIDITGRIATLEQHIKDLVPFRQKFYLYVADLRNAAGGESCLPRQEFDDLKRFVENEATRLGVILPFPCDRHPGAKVLESSDMFVVRLPAQTPPLHELLPSSCLPVPPVNNVERFVAEPMFSVSVYDRDGDTPVREDLTLELRYRDACIAYAMNVADWHPECFAEVWERDTEGLYGNSGVPIFATEGSSYHVQQEEGSLP